MTMVHLRWTNPQGKKNFRSQTLKVFPIEIKKNTHLPNEDSPKVLRSSSGSQRSRSPGSSGWHRLAFWFGASLCSAGESGGQHCWASWHIMTFQPDLCIASLTGWHRHSAAACSGCMQGYHLACFPMATGNGAVQRGILASHPKWPTLSREGLKPSQSVQKPWKLWPLATGCTWIFVSAKLHTAGGLSSAHHGLLIMNLGQRRPTEIWFPHLSWPFM